MFLIIQAKYLQYSKSWLKLNTRLSNCSYQKHDFDGVAVAGVMIGVIWICCGDVFAFKIKFLKLRQTITKFKDIVLKFY